MNIFQFLGAIELGLIYGMVAVAVFLTFRVLDFPDLTVDGTFPMGMAISGALILSGTNPIIATIVAMCGGALAGMVTAWLNVRWKILHLLASILTMTALYSVNLRIMGRPNLSLIHDKTIFTALSENLGHTYSVIAICFGFSVALIWIIYRFLQSEIGLALRATGKNPKMSIAQGIETKYMIFAGLALSNALIALAGAIWTQSQGFADVTLGPGTIIAGLAAVLIGEAIFHTKNLFIGMISCIVGSIVYRFVIAFALNAHVLGLDQSDLRLVEAIIVGSAMIISCQRSSINQLVCKVGVLSKFINAFKRGSSKDGA